MFTGLSQARLDGSGASEKNSDRQSDTEFRTGMETRLGRVLDTGDLELRFHDGRSIKAHSLKLKIASLDGVLHNLIEDVVDDQITGAKRKRSGDCDSDTVANLPCLKVRG